MPSSSETNLLKAHDAVVRAAVAIDGKQTEYRIEGVERLTLRVEASGSAAYYVRYRANGKPQRLRIGTRGVMSLRDARAKAREIRLAVASGGDPVAAAAERANSPTPRQLWEERKQHGKALSPGTQKYYEQALNQYAFPELGDVPADEITTDQMASLLRKVKRVSKHRAHAVGSAISSTYSWAYSERLVKTNPTIGLSFSYAPPARERVASAEEIGKLWLGIEREERLTRRMRTILKLVMVTGLRNSNIAKMRTDQLLLDVANPELRIKREHMKNKKQGHVLPLTPLMVELLRQGSDMSGEYVFPGEGPAPYVAQQSVSRAMNKLSTRLGIEDMHNHDFRHTLITWMAENGIAYEVRTKIAHHAVKGVHDRVYNHSLLKGPMREALEKWEKYVLECAAREASGQVENVVPLQVA